MKPYNNKVDYSNFHVFGCKILFLETKGKLKSNAKKGILLGYDENSTGFRIFDIDNMKIKVKGVVEFLEDQPGNFNYDFVIGYKGKHVENNPLVHFYNRNFYFKKENKQENEEQNEDLNKVSNEGSDNVSNDDSMETISDEEQDSYIRK